MGAVPNHFRLTHTLINQETASISFFLRTDRYWILFWKIEYINVQVVFLERSIEKSSTTKLCVFNITLNNKNWIDYQKYIFFTAPGSSLVFNLWKYNFSIMCVYWMRTISLFFWCQSWCFRHKIFIQSPSKLGYPGSDWHFDQVSINLNAWDSWKNAFCSHLNISNTWNNIHRFAYAFT